ncbi:MAG: lipopolysaccharide kinase InaA family protein [Halioglobus sp.]
MFGNCQRCARITIAFDADELHRCALQLTEDYLPDNWLRVSSTVFSRVAVNSELGLYYKEYLTRSPAESIRARVRGSRATRARINSDALLLAGIDAPRNVHWGKLPQGREYLFTETAPGVGINRWLTDSLAERQGESLRTRRQLLHALGTFIGRVHATGFIHGDLRPSNVLAAQVQDQFRFTLIANERNVFKTPTPGKMLLRNLTQLNTLPLADLSRTDRMRFFRAWRKQMRDLSVMEAKVLAAEAFRRALRRVANKDKL